MLVDMGECSLRAAAEMTNLRYKGEGIPSIAKSSVGNYRSEPSYSPVAPGCAPNIPDTVTDKLVQWIRARRALKFPVFRDDVLATANLMLQGTAILKLFKHGMGDVAWYYRMLSKYAHVLGTADQQPLEIDRARWATAENIKAWYDVLAAALVMAGVLPKSVAEVEALTIPKLQGLLLRDDGQKWENAHSKLKAKGELVAAVKALYGSRLLLLAPLPPQMLALPTPQ